MPTAYTVRKIYSACGRQYFAHVNFEAFRSFVRENGMEDWVTFEEMDGVHCWDVWDPMVHHFVDMLPLKGRGIWRKWYNERHPEAR